MDAANPLRRWIGTVGRLSLLAGLTAGCTTDKQLTRTSDPPARDAAAPAKARGQAPIAPAYPVEPTPGYPVGNPAPVVGLPVSTSVPGQPVAPRNEPTAPVSPPEPGFPVVPAGPAPAAPPASATQASYSPSRPDPALREFLLTDKPRVKVVAIVGKGNIITDDEVWQSVRQRPDHRNAVIAADRDRMEAEMYRFELKKLIERELLIDDMFNKMKKAKPGAADEIKEFASKAADRHIREARRMYGFTNDQEFQDKALAPQGLTVNVIRRQIERNTISAEYIRSLVREKAKGIGLGDIHEFYMKHQDKFQNPDRAKWMDLFIAYDKFPTPQEAYKHAEAVRKQAAEGADFAALVKQHDHGDATFRNGEGAGQLRGEIRPAELEPVVFQTQPGQVSALIQVAAGYHIIKVVERDTAGTKPFNEKTQTAIRGMLFEQMQQRESSRLVEDLWRKGAVEVIDVP